ncbi:DAK2 domain-containing protein [Nocardioides sp.]|uniref:DAK2 domain-containing protein n=1 Tax=Nocardioides sp. TaxID=35761 RepID=UPI0035135A95
MEQAPISGHIELGVVVRFIDAATDALAAAREEIDALNVYPVPDGDTGTNLYLTISAARDAVHAVLPADAGGPGGPGEDEQVLPDDDGDRLRDAALAALARGALLGARGNSGVILSEILGAITRRLATATAEERNARIVAAALEAAATAAYAAVGTPVEGTMLTVVREAAEAALARAEQPDARARDVFTEAARAARESLARTPDLLPLLRDAGVVDAGGRGMCVLLDAVETVLTGRRPMAVAPRGQRSIPVPLVPLDGPAHEHTADGPAYEVMYLLDTTATGEDGIGALRRTLAGLGDSLVVVGGEGLWNVHVHVDDVGAAIEAGLEAGRPHRIRVTHFADQAARSAASTAGRAPGGRRGRAVVAVAAGPGLSRLFAEAGARVVEGGPGRRPSTGALLGAIADSGAAEVIVLPNDHDTVRTAEVAARTAEADLGLRVAVVPAVAQVQGLAALAVHEPGRAFDSDVLEMTATARHARQGGVTIAAKRALTMAGWCEPGDVLGVIEGDFVVIGQDQAAVAAEVLGRLLAGGGELVTLVAGAGGEALRDAAAAWVDAHHPHVDVVGYDGGQDRYPLLLAVE